MSVTGDRLMGAISLIRSLPCLAEMLSDAADSGVRPNLNAL